MSIKIVNKEGADVPRMVTIARYFRKPDETVSQFQEGCKGLSEADKDELAIGAAKELGYEVVGTKS